MNNSLQKILRAEAAINANFVARDQEIRAIYLAILAKKNILLIGAPGVAKSSVIDQVMRTFSLQFKTFTRLISPTTQPEELFGSAKFEQLRQGVIERNITNQLPEAHLAFLDEIFKSTSDLLNGLLKIMNEHRFENGTNIIEAPLFTLIGASNEFPEEEQLAALYDRFLIRREVEPLKTADQFLTMLRSSTDEQPLPQITLKDIEVLQNLTAQVTIPEAILQKLVTIHFQLKDEGVNVSDRRTKQCLSLLQAHAVLNERDVVLQKDLFILLDALWVDAADREIVKAILQEHILTPADHLLEKAQALQARVNVQLSTFKQQMDYEKFSHLGSETLLQLEILHEDLVHINAELIPVEQQLYEQQFTTIKNTLEKQFAELLL